MPRTEKLRSRPARHPDLAVLSTDRVIISIDEVRELVQRSQYSPTGRPLPRDDHRRRRPHGRAHLQRAAQGARRAAAAHGLDPVRAERGRPHPDHPLAGAHRAAAGARGRRGRRAARAPRRRRCRRWRPARRARRSPTSAWRTGSRPTRRRADDASRRSTLALGIRSVSGAVLAAAQLLELAGDDAKAITEERDAEERDGALRSLGIEPGGTVPPALRAQLKQLDDDQKRRATRSLRDGIDRILVDLLSLYRDVLLAAARVADRADQPAGRVPAARRGRALDARRDARDAWMPSPPPASASRATSPALALEAMLVVGIRKGRR